MKVRFPQLALTITILALLSGAGPSFGLAAAHHVPPIRIGAVYPLVHGGAPARQEYDGLRTAVRLVNQQGGIHGRHVRLMLKNIPVRDDAPAAVAGLAHHHVTAIVGSAESLVGVPASEAAQAHHVIYLEAGAVATMLTDPGLPDVFRTVTTGQTLGRSAADFAARVVAQRLRIPVRRLRVAVINVRDVYGSSVAAAQVAETRRLGMHLVSHLRYDLATVRFPRLVRALKRSRPDVVLVAAYLQDAIRFRRETIRQHLRVGAMIGTSSSFCMPAFGDTLGREAVGLFASDKPDIHVNTRALRPAARRLRRVVVRLYHHLEPGDMTGPAVAGFVGGWVLLHDILPRARSLTTPAIRVAALRINLPWGSQINGAGVRFAPPSAPDAGQNLRAASVVWQWQKPGRAVIVAPQAYATGRPRFIPLPLYR